MRILVLEKPLKYSNWRIEDNRLYKYVKPKYTYPPLTTDYDAWKLVVSKGDRRKIIEEAHLPPTSGHMGIYKTVARIQDKCFWPKQRNDVIQFIRNCSKCSAYKPEQRAPVGLMASHPKATKPWVIISMDLMGPLPHTKRGTQYILVVTDYFSKFSLTFALKKSTTSKIIRILEDNKRRRNII